MKSREAKNLVPVLRIACLRLLLVVAAISASAAPALLAQETTGKANSWSGVLVTSACNADEAFNESPECFKNVPGAQVALYDDTNRLMYSLEPQDKVTGHLGDTVTVGGRLEEDTIHVASCGPMTIGLEVGQRAPDFSAHDEFGKLQTLETLKGKNGTVLLFFRSADW